MNIHKHQKVFYFTPFSSLSPQKLIYSSVWFVVKAERDTAAATDMRIYIFSELKI